MHATDDTARPGATAAPSNLREARALVKVMIHRIAPNLEDGEIDRLDSLHDVADFDSLDFVQLMTLVAELTGVSIPPRDYPRVITIDGFATHLWSHARPT